MEQLELINKRKSDSISVIEQHKLCLRSTKSLQSSSIKSAIDCVIASNKRFIKYISDNPAANTREIIFECNSNNPHAHSMNINKELIAHNQPIQIVKIPPADNRGQSWNWYLVKSDVAEKINQEREHDH